MSMYPSQLPSYLRPLDPSIDVTWTTAVMVAYQMCNLTCSLLPGCHWGEMKRQPLSHQSLTPTGQTTTLIPTLESRSMQPIWTNSLRSTIKSYCSYPGKDHGWTLASDTLISIPDQFQTSIQDPATHDTDSPTLNDRWPSPCAAVVSDPNTPSMNLCLLGLMPQSPPVSWPLIIMWMLLLKANLHRC